MIRLAHLFEDAPATISSLHNTTANTTLNDIMWEPSQEYIQQTLFYKFKEHVNIRGEGYEELWKMVDRTQR